MWQASNDACILDKDTACFKGILQQYPQLDEGHVKNKFEYKSHKYEHSDLDLKLHKISYI